MSLQCVCAACGKQESRVQLQLHDESEWKHAAHELKVLKLHSRPLQMGMIATVMTFTGGSCRQRLKAAAE